MSGFIKDLANPKGKYGIWGIVVLVSFGVALMVLPRVIFSPEKVPLTNNVNYLPTSEASGSSLASLEKDLADELSRILNQVAGAGEVAVTVTLAAGPEQNYAQNSTMVNSNIEERDTNGGTRSTTETNEKTEVVFSQKGGEALVIQEIGPQIKGVLVVAEGAQKPAIKAQLSEAVQTILNLPAHRVMVLAKEGR